MRRENQGNLKFVYQKLPYKNEKQQSNNNNYMIVWSWMRGVEERGGLDRQEGEV
jgi:hypothetical protein